MMKEMRDEFDDYKKNLRKLKGKDKYEREILLLERDDCLSAGMCIKTYCKIIDSK